MGRVGRREASLDGRCASVGVARGSGRGPCGGAYIELDGGNLMELGGGRIALEEVDRGMLALTGGW